MSSDLVFEIPRSALDEFLEDVAAFPELKPEAHETAAASGGGDLTTVLIALGPTTIASLTALVTVWIKRGATVEIGGQKVTGISRSVADQLARKLAEAHAGRPDVSTTFSAAPPALQARDRKPNSNQ